MMHFANAHSPTIRLVTPYTMLSPECPITLFSVVENEQLYYFKIQALFPIVYNNISNEDYYKYVWVKVCMNNEFNGEIASAEGREVCIEFDVSKKHYSKKDILDWYIDSREACKEYEIIKKPIVIDYDFAIGNTTEDFTGIVTFNSPTWVVDIESFMKERSIWSNLLLRAFHYNLHQYRKSILDKKRNSIIENK